MPTIEYLVPFEISEWFDIVKIRIHFDSFVFLAGMFHRQDQVDLGIRSADDRNALGFLDCLNHHRIALRKGRHDRIIVVRRRSIDEIRMPASIENVVVLRTVPQLDRLADPGLVLRCGRYVSCVGTSSNSQTDQDSQNPWCSHRNRFLWKTGAIRATPAQPLKRREPCRLPTESCNTPSLECGPDYTTRGRGGIDRSLMIEKRTAWSPAGPS